MGIYSDPVFCPVGECAVSVEVGDDISPIVGRRVRELTAQIDSLAAEWLIDVVPAYRSILVYYDPVVVTFETVTAQLSRLAAAAPAALPPPRLIHVPVHYGGSDGPDIQFVADHAGLSVADVVATHAAADYLVHMIGFTPGYPYLGGTPARLAVPRLETPRLRVPSGSLAIAQQQTGIYPIESPGGFRLIGRTPVPLFDARLDPPALMRAGDTVRFVPVEESAYADIEAEVRAGTYRVVITGTEAS